jgi:hypothetical protein
LKVGIQFSSVQKLAAEESVSSSQRPEYETGVRRENTRYMAFISVPLLISISVD